MGEMHKESDDALIFPNHCRSCVKYITCALILRELNQTFIAYLFKGGQEQSFFLQKLLFMAFLVTILKILTYAVRTCEHMILGQLWI